MTVHDSQKEVTKTIDAFIEEKIPVDAIILDLFWFGKEMKGTMGNLEFHKDSFPNPEKMIADLKQIFNNLFDISVNLILLFKKSFTNLSLALTIIVSNKESSLLKLLRILVIGNLI